MKTPTCCLDKCNARRRPEDLFCARHWGMVPKSVRREIQRQDRVRAQLVPHTADWLKACDRMRDAIARALRLVYKAEGRLR